MIPGPSISPAPVRSQVTAAGVQPASTASPEQIRELNAASSPLRYLAFYFAVAAIFIRFSLIHEALTFTTGFNNRLLYLVIPPALLGVVMSGGLGRTLRARVTYWWIAFVCWMTVAVVFSSWRGGSFWGVLTYIRADFPMLFVLGGLAMTWKECRAILNAIGAAAVVDMIVSRVFLNMADSRVSLFMGDTTIDNPNDLAGHLLLLLPFLLLLFLSKNVPKLFRLASVPLMGYCVYLILGTASRGAMVALVGGVLFTFAKASGRAKLLILTSAPVMLVIMFSILPHRTVDRLLTLNTKAEDADPEAAESAEARRYLLRKSVEYTITHPLFGVGPQQFSSYEGMTMKKAGKRGSWHDTHNMYTQISSECGIPALIFYVGAIAATFGLVNRTYKRARRHPQGQEIAKATFCVLLAMVMFYTATFFLNFGYYFYQPALSGLAIVLAFAAERELASRGSGPEAGGVSWRIQSAATAGGTRGRLA